MTIGPHPLPPLFYISYNPNWREIRLPKSNVKINKNFHRNSQTKNLCVCVCVLYIFTIELKSAISVTIL